MSSSPRSDLHDSLRPLTDEERQSFTDPTAKMVVKHDGDIRDCTDPNCVALLADHPRYGVEQPAPGYGRRHFGPGDKALIVAGVKEGPLHADEAGTFRKRARLIAVRMNETFEVETDQGIVRGEVGDWLATNHPDDDPGSDVWVVSAERMAATYEQWPDPLRSHIADQVVNEPAD